MYYFVTKLTFESKISPWLFDVFAQFLSWILTLCQKVTHYLVDFLLIESPAKAPINLQTLLTVLKDLNVIVAAHKVDGPAKVITFMGITLDTVIT